MIDDFSQILYSKLEDFKMAGLIVEETRNGETRIFATEKMQKMTKEEALELIGKMRYERNRWLEEEEGK